MKERMGRLRGTNETWLDIDLEQVEAPVGGLGGGDNEELEGGKSIHDLIGRAGDFEFRVESVWGWVLGALSWTKNTSALKANGISYKLIKSIRDTW